MPTLRCAPGGQLQPDAYRLHKCVGDCGVHCWCTFEAARAAGQQRAQRGMQQPQGGFHTWIPFLVRDSRLSVGSRMSHSRLPTTPAVRRTSHFSSLAGSRAAAMVLRVAPAGFTLQHVALQPRTKLCPVLPTAGAAFSHLHLHRHLQHCAGAQQA
jgi:hypothetical protein